MINTKRQRLEKLKKLLQNLQTERKARQSQINTLVDDMIEQTKRQIEQLEKQKY